MLQHRCGASQMKELVLIPQQWAPKQHISVFINVGRQQLNFAGGHTLNMLFLWEKSPRDNRLFDLLITYTSSLFAQFKYNLMGKYLNF